MATWSIRKPYAVPRPKDRYIHRKVLVLKSSDDPEVYVLYIWGTTENMQMAPEAKPRDS